MSRISFTLGSLVLACACSSSDDGDPSASDGAVREDSASTTDGGRTEDGSSVPGKDGSISTENDGGSTPSEPYCAFLACRTNADCPEEDCGLLPEQSYGYCGYVDPTCTTHADCTNPDSPACVTHPTQTDYKYCSPGCRTDGDCTKTTEDKPVGKCNARNQCEYGCSSTPQCQSSLGAGYECSFDSTVCTGSSLGRCVKQTCELDCSHLGEGGMCRLCSNGERCVKECSSDQFCRDYLSNENAVCEPGTKTCIVTKTENGSCRNDGDCIASQFCSEPCYASSYPCTPVKRCMDRCTSNSDCDKGTCDGRVCTCSSNADCPALHKCDQREVCGETCGPKSCTPTGQCQNDDECRRAFDEGYYGEAYSATDRKHLACVSVGETSTCAFRCTTANDCKEGATMGTFLAAYREHADDLICLSGGCVLGCETDEMCASAAPDIEPSWTTGICLGSDS